MHRHQSATFSEPPALECCADIGEEKGVHGGDQGALGSALIHVF